MKFRPSQLVGNQGLLVRRHKKTVLSQKVSVYMTVLMYTLEHVLRIFGRSPMCVFDLHW